MSHAETQRQKKWEAIAWLDRTLPLSARFPKGCIFREYRPPVPAEALREVILNAVMHRDFSLASSHVAIAVYDDRIEVRSVGAFPTGIRAEMLSGDHPSILRNPLISGALHRTGAVEVWGRGTNRVIEACHAHGIAPPEFSEQAGVVTVTFWAMIAESRPRLEHSLLGDDPLSSHDSKIRPTQLFQDCA